MHKYKCRIAYDGTAYHGFQIQKKENSLLSEISIQESIEKVLAQILQSPISIIGAGRTDAGVHATGQVAHFTTEKAINALKLQIALNALLPPDIRILTLEEAPFDFHARYSAISKEYHYHLHLEKARDPFTYRYKHHVLFPISLQLLEEAIPYFIGTHNFSSFSNDNTKGSCGKNPVRTLYSLEIIKQEGGVRLEFKGNGFLYKMVRNITGTLLEVGYGKIKPCQIPTIFEKNDRKQAGATAPAQGLFLVNVFY